MGTQDLESGAGYQVRLEIEGVVDDGVTGKEPLG